MRQEPLRWALCCWARRPYALFFLMNFIAWSGDKSSGWPCILFIVCKSPFWLLCGLWSLATALQHLCPTRTPTAPALALSRKKMTRIHALCLQGTHGRGCADVQATFMASGEASSRYHLRTGTTVAPGFSARRCSGSGAKCWNTMLIACRRRWLVVPSSWRTEKLIPLSRRLSSGNVCAWMGLRCAFFS